MLAGLEVRRIRAGLAHHPTPSLAFDRSDPEVDVGSEPPVEGQLAEAIQIALPLCREGDEAQIDVLVELEDPIVSQEDVGQVRLDDRDWIGERAGCRERLGNRGI